MSEIPVAPADLDDPRLRYWVQGARPHTLKLIVAPLIVGLALAWHLTGQIALLPSLAALASALLIQIATNIANDAADGARGLDGPGRLGPPRITGLGLLSPAEMRQGALIATAGAMLFGLVCAWFGGWPILLAGLASIAAGWAYSYGPRPISMSPFGEVFVIAFFGLVATAGMLWLAGRVFAPSALALGLAIGLPAAAVLTVNNHRDRHQDALNGRRTIPILIGEPRTHAFYAAELVAAPLIAAAALWPLRPAGAVLVLAALPLALWLARDLARTPISVRLNRCLANTARFQVVLAGLIALALAGLP